MVSKCLPPYIVFVRRSRGKSNRDLQHSPIMHQSIIVKYNSTHLFLSKDLMIYPINFYGKSLKPTLCARQTPAAQPEFINQIYERGHRKALFRKSANLIPVMPNLL